MNCSIALPPYNQLPRKFLGPCSDSEPGPWCKNRTAVGILHELGVIALRRDELVVDLGEPLAGAVSTDDCPVAVTDDSVEK